MVTVSHVVNLAEGVQVVFHDGHKSKARIISTQPDTDLALLQLIDMPDNLKFSQLGNSDNSQIGEEIFVLGAPFGARSMSTGIISSKLPIKTLSVRDSSYKPTPPLTRVIPVAPCSIKKVR